MNFWRWRVTLPSAYCSSVDMSGADHGRFWRCASAALVAWGASTPAQTLAAEAEPASVDAQRASPATEGARSEAAPRLPCLSVAASEQNDPARLLDFALSCYEAEEYEASLVLLKRLRSIDPNPVVLFNLGASHAALAHCAEAREYYELYLQQTQSEAGKVEAREQLQTLRDCEGAPSSQSAQARNAEPLPGTAPASEPARPGAMVLRPAQPVTEGGPYAGFETIAPEPPSRLASWILLGGSAALAVAAGGFAYASERAEHAEARNELSTGDAIADSQEDGRRYNTLAWACAGGALALATSGLLLIAFEPSEHVAGSGAKTLQSGAWSLRLQHEF
jgi:hypothetical protein